MNTRTRYVWPLSRYNEYIRLTTIIYNVNIIRSIQTTAISNWRSKSQTRSVICRRPINSNHRPTTQARPFTDVLRANFLVDDHLAITYYTW